MYATISNIKKMREIILLSFGNKNSYDWEWYHSKHIVYVSKLRLNHISSHLFHSIVQTLNGFNSKRRFGKIAPIPKHLKNLRKFF